MSKNPEGLKANQYIGIIKFFREKEHLEMFLDGTVYCNTSAYYRNSNQKGVSDRNESCMFNLDVNRGDTIESFTINGIEVEPPLSVITRQGRKDGWLHCWAIIQLPENDEDFINLNNDIKRLQKEFGSYYAYVNAPDSYTLTDRINTLTESLTADKVTYFEGGYLGHSVLHKDNKYSYQREYRFIIDECDNDTLTPKVLKFKGGFRDIVQSSPEIKLIAETELQKFKLVIKQNLTITSKRKLIVSN